MSFPCCSSCVVVLDRQQEQNISHQKQCRDVPAKYSQNTGKNSTVVENGRVVVKPSQPPINETSS
ncbi:MAG: hypothetical protein V7K47_08550 [Nostoc sp.]